MAKWQFCSVIAGEEPGGSLAVQVSINGAGLERGQVEIILAGAPPDEKRRLLVVEPEPDPEGDLAFTLSQTLNRLGEEGWEPFQVQEESGLWYFKRPLPVLDNGNES